MTRLNDMIAEITLEIKKDWRSLAERRMDMRSMFYDIHRTVMNAVRRAGYSLIRVLIILGISRSW